jgi:hypothetical protein
VAGGKDDIAEIKLKELKHEEGHIALGEKLLIELHATIYGLNLTFCFCNLLARVYKVRPLCSWGSAFGHKFAESVPTQ